MAARQDDGDPQHQLGTLVREHRSVLMTRALRLTAGDRAWAEDVVQETFIRAWQHLDRMTEEHGSVRSWLLRVVHNLAVDGHRARLPQPAGAVNIEMNLRPVRDFSPDVLASVHFDEALAGLAERHRAVLEEVYGRDRSLADTAGRLGLPVGTVKSRVFYALRQLRASMPVQDCPDGDRRAAGWPAT